MRYLFLFAALSVSNSVFADGDDFYKSYSVVSSEGDLPIRNVVVKKVGENFTSYRGFQVNCESRKLSETGFYGSPDAALRALSTLKSADRTFKLLTDEVWTAACGTEQPTVVSDNVPPPKTS